MTAKTVVLIDGGFVKKKLQERAKSFPTVDEVVGLTHQVMKHPRLEETKLFRIFYYDAPPLAGTAVNPIDGAVTDFSSTPIARKNRHLIDSLELEPDFAVRRGQLLQTGWKLGSRALRKIRKSKGAPIEGRDIVPDISQKGVDIRIGLDIASIALKRVAQNLVLISGDSDFVPVMKLARKEGMKVYLEAMGHGVRRELKAHADLIL